MADSANYLNKAGAEALARRLNDYWHARGWPLATHWIEMVRCGKDKDVYCVRSNLVNGRPPVREAMRRAMG